MTIRDALSRTLKLELDSGRASNIEDAEALVGGYVLQVVVGPEAAHSDTHQAVLLTVVNAGVRAFAGGVRVFGDLDWPITTSWFQGLSALQAIDAFGARTDLEPSDAHATVVIGSPPHTPCSAVVVHPTWNGWAGGVVTNDKQRLKELVENPLAGVAAGAIAVSETFQHVRGSGVAGRRDTGLSLWDPSRPWRSDGAAGPPLRYLPSRLWILGLGHLGQAFLWLLGFLPYSDRSRVELWLQDFDAVVEANRSTGLLVTRDTPPGVLKTRVASECLEALGFRTRLVERRFDQTSSLGVDEPTWAISGFDAPEPRRHLDRFDFVVDVGLGADHDDYLGIHIHTFPAAGAPRDLFATPDRVKSAEQLVWASEASDDRCGMVQLANVAVGAAFVGAFASSLALTELLRVLAGEPATAVASCTLSALEHFESAVDGVHATNPGFELALPRKQ